jgi:hypothetical protein
MLYKQGETAALEKLVSVRGLIHRAVVPQNKLADHIRTIKDKIAETATGEKQ